jgi:glycosyltransferase involved in cell wall biosynthesis
MFHRWELMCEAFPGSQVILTRKPDPSRPWTYDPETMKFPCIRAEETFHFSHHLAWSRALSRVVRSARNQSVVHLFEDVSGLNMLSIIGLTGKGNYLLVSDGGFPDTTARPTQGLRRILVGRRCFGAIAPGISGRRYLHAWGFPEDRIYNSYLSPDVDALVRFRESEAARSARNEIRANLNLKSTDRLVLCVSRLLDWKRIEDFADAIDLLPPAALNRACFILIGDGPFTGPLKLLQSKNIRFKWIPGIPYNEVMNYYTASDFTVLPSEGDIWGLVVNEALTMGKPVICTDRIGSAELVKNDFNGFTVPIRNPEALSQRIALLLSNDELLNEFSINAKSIENTWHSKYFIDELKRLLTDLKGS